MDSLSVPLICPPIFVKFNFVNENISQKTNSYQTYFARILLFSHASRNISGLHKLCQLPASRHLSDLSCDADTLFFAGAGEGKSGTRQKQTRQEEMGAVFFAVRGVSIAFWIEIPYFYGEKPYNCMAENKFSYL
jgi:hypothetical protein